MWTKFDDDNEDNDKTNLAEFDSSRLNTPIIFKVKVSRHRDVNDNHNKTPCVMMNIEEINWGDSKSRQFLLLLLMLMMMRKRIGATVQDSVS